MKVNGLVSGAVEGRCREFQPITLYVNELKKIKGCGWVELGISIEALVELRFERWSCPVSNPTTKDRQCQRWS